MLPRLRCLWNRLVSFAEKQGFPVIVTICVGVITASALWRNPTDDHYVSPTPPVNQDVSAAQLLQESLRDVATASPAPTAAPPAYCPPLDAYSILQPYDAASMVQSCSTGLWRVHAGVDLAAQRGSPVRAIADGVVIAHGNDTLQGAWLLIAHGEIQALYAGMVMTEDYIAGDKVGMNDVIGYVGQGTLDDSSREPHLHLETTKNGAPVDPCALWQSS